jgi:predicted MFS family arabinose efflux permease
MAKHSERNGLFAGDSRRNVTQHRRMGQPRVLRIAPDKRPGLAYASAVRPRQLKFGYFTLEACNSFAGTFFLFYLFFLMRDEFGFNSRDNLLLSAVHGLFYVFGSWQGGKFVQRRGCFTALKLGFAGMAVGLSLGLGVPGIGGQVLALIGWTLPCCLIWPALETLVTEGEDFHGTARMVGGYNVVWSAGGALAFFSGGWLWEKLGRSGLYGITIALMIGQLLLTLWLERSAKQILLPAKPISEPPHRPEVAVLHQSLPPQRFLQMAWLANPFAYVAINTIGAVMPQLAQKFSLSPAQSGVFCSLWFFARTFAFVGLWQWTGWHYRFRWLLAAFVGLVASFGTMMLAGQLWLVLGAQLVFGCAVGLIYYSSLFYSMDVGEAKGEHGGLHEAAIGLGICVGPAVGAVTLHLIPQSANAGTWAVSVLLCSGLAGLMGLRLKALNSRSHD